MLKFEDAMVLSLRHDFQTKDISLILYFVLTTPWGIDAMVIVRTNNLWIILQLIKETEVRAPKGTMIPQEEKGKGI